MGMSTGFIVAWTWSIVWQIKIRRSLFLKATCRQTSGSWLAVANGSVIRLLFVVKWSTILVVIVFSRYVLAFIDGQSWKRYLFVEELVILNKSRGWKIRSSRTGWWFLQMAVGILFARSWSSQTIRSARARTVNWNDSFSTSCCRVFPILKRTSYLIPTLVPDN